MRKDRLSSALGAALLLAALASQPAGAQGIPTTSRGFQPPTKQKNLPEYQPTTPPPALPGTLNLAPPAERTQTDLGPTEALFDAINRGDLEGARDALNRGADLGGRSVLGMTPLELSVDLGRNDITFLLLSQRPGASPGVPAAGRTATATAAVKPAPGKVAPKLPTTSAATTVAAAKPAAAPPLLANPGTPNPQAGFLGFGDSPQ